MDHYEVLGVAPTAPDNVIRAAYHALIRECHPDRLGPTGEARTRELNQARDVLLDPAARAAYDATLDSSHHETPPKTSQFDDDWGTEEVVDEHQAPPPPPPGPGQPWSAPPPQSPPTYGPGATPWVPQDSSAQDAPVAPPPYSGYSGATSFAAKQGIDWSSAVKARTPLQRWAGYAWVVLALMSPIAAVASALKGDNSNLVGSLMFYGLGTWLAASGGAIRVTTGRVSKRYLATCAMSVLMMVATASSPITSNFVLAWLVAYVVAVESRRKGRQIA